MAVLILTAACSIFRPWHTEIYKGQTIVTGKVTPEIIARYTGDWFWEKYREYQPYPDIIEALQKQGQNIKAEVYMGTWCPDSREYVPVFYKIADEAGWDRKNIRLIALPRNFKDAKVARKRKIFRVPTFIIYLNGKEKGRIIEYPMENMEQDLRKILIGKYRHELQDYTP